VVAEVRESAGLAVDASITWISAIERGLTVDADPDQLFRVLLNLVRNAAQALESRPRGEGSPLQIRITGRREGSVAIIEVSDTGPGVPAKAREHLFEAFQTSGRPGGSGLGLAIAAELIRAHGGDIHLVEGTIGATFRTLPRGVSFTGRRQASTRAKLSKKSVLSRNLVPVGDLVCIHSIGGKRGQKTETAERLVSRYA